MGLPFNSPKNRHAFILFLLFGPFCLFFLLIILVPLQHKCRDLSINNTMILCRGFATRIVYKVQCVTE